MDEHGKLLMVIINVIIMNMMMGMRARPVLPAELMPAFRATNNT